MTATTLSIRVSRSRSWTTCSRTSVPQLGQRPPGLRTSGAAAFRADERELNRHRRRGSEEANAERQYRPHPFAGDEFQPREQAGELGAQRLECGAGAGAAADRQKPPRPRVALHRHQLIRGEARQTFASSRARSRPPSWSTSPSACAWRPVQTRPCAAAATARFAQASSGGHFADEVAVEELRFRPVDAAALRRRAAGSPNTSRHAGRERRSPWSHPSDRTTRAAAPCRPTRRSSR